MDQIQQYLKFQHDKEELVMIKESFSQLYKLEDECNQELSAFQRENFNTHEEFRTIISRLHEQINTFGENLNKELDSLELKINKLEILTMHAFNIHSEKIITANGAQFITRSQYFIYVSFRDGSINAYDSETFKVKFSTQKSSYDLINSYGKITCFTYCNRLFVGFFSGMVIGFDDKLATFKQLSYNDTSINVISQCGDLIIIGADNGIVSLWNSETLQRILVVPDHHLPIASIFQEGDDIVIVGKTGIFTKYDHYCSKQNEKYHLGRQIIQVLPLRQNTYVLISDELLVWEGKRITKTFNAVDIGSNALGCIKLPELLLIGNKDSPELKLIFLDSLLFPKVVNVLDSPPISIFQYGSYFYILTKSGNVYVIKPGK